MPTEEEIKAKLTPEQYHVLREKGTEAPFSGKYVHEKADGTYNCMVCGNPLFASDTKFDSGTGWPSFVRPITPNAVVEKINKGFFSTRTEIRSKIADSHIGHVFNDGPQERGGKRYCMNSAAMKFIPKADMEKMGYGEYIQFVE